MVRVTEVKVQNEGDKQPLYGPEEAMFSQGLIEEQRTRGHLLFPILVSRVGSHPPPLSLYICLLGTGYDHDSCDQFSSLSALPWQLGRCKRQGSDKQEGRSGLQSGDLMGQSPWFLLQWSQAEAHSLVPLRAGRQAQRAPMVPR